MTKEGKNSRGKYFTALISNQRKIKVGKIYKPRGVKFKIWPRFPAKLISLLYRCSAILLLELSDIEMLLRSSIMQRCYSYFFSLAVVKSVARPFILTLLIATRFAATKEGNFYIQLGEFLKLTVVSVC